MTMMSSSSWNRCLLAFIKASSTRASITAALVVELEQAELAALAVDDAEITDDAGQQLRLARVDQVGQFALDEAAHLQRHLVEQVPER